MRRPALDSVVLLGFAALLLTAPLQAQRTTGQVNGTVRDDSGAVLPGVTVALSGDKIVGTQTAVTTDNGFYRFIALPPGTYELNFTLDGFAPQTRSGIRVSVGSTTVENAALGVGEVAEAITVTAESPVIDTESNEVGANYDRDWVENAPMQRLSFNDRLINASKSSWGIRSIHSMVVN